MGLLGKGEIVMARTPQKIEFSRSTDCDFNHLVGSRQSKMDFSQDTAAGGQLSLTILQSVEELIQYQEEWDHFVEAAGSDIYFVVDWLQTWLKFYGKNSEIKCYVVTQQEKIVAVLPFCIERLRIGFISIRVVRVVGSYGTMSVLSPPIEPGFEVPVMKAVLSSLFANNKIDAVCLSPLSGINPLSLIENWDEVSDNKFGFQEKKDVGIHTVFDLPDTFDEYLHSFGKSTRRSYNKSNRLLSDDFKIENRIVEGESAVKFFDNFASLHTKLWKHVGKLGHFGEWPDGLEFNRELVRKLAPKGQAKFHDFSAEEKPLCMTYLFELGEISYMRLSARDPDPEMMRFSLGRVGHGKCLEFLIDDGLKLAEAGPGHYDYKTALGGKEYQMKRLIFTRFSSRVRMRIYLLMSEYLDFFYYRLWFKKLSPKLRLRSRPLWAFWVKAKL
ncbi:GNAT family N-acetyltransferase [Sneathiella marina]|uniref:GNAT family N-acetyltransferase n=1 Tax=Sneathiella marina TaxID=2950108 RepID=A0ABY4W2M1_9PROT|nr:GNAT family N-acetyltransferase [Sneathiella marina]USG61308.1 GNAT family N-acetyltransferase [Sneathiella marina]